MAAKGNIVKFIQFNGTPAEWQAGIQSGAWVNAIVFGYIWDEDKGKFIKKIYAGQDTYGVDYIYEFCECDGSGRWTWGNVEEGWHDKDAVITNNIGQIKAGTTLEELINQCDNGDFSRIIEKMLFKPEQIVIKDVILTTKDASVEVSQKQMLLTVSIPTGTEPHAKFGKSTTLYDDCDDVVFGDPVYSKDGYDTYKVLIDSFDENNLASNTSYKVIVTASDGSQTSDPVEKTTKTDSYAAPVVETAITLTSTDMPTGNNMKLSVSGGNINAKDYANNTLTVYKLTKDGAEVFSGSLAELTEHLNNTEYPYNSTYKVTETFTGSTSDYKGAHETTTATANALALPKPVNSLKVTKVNDEAYNAATVYEISSNNIIVDLTASSTVLDASIYVSYSGEELAYDITTTLLAIPVNPSDDEQTTTIYVKDIYGNETSKVVIKFKYTVALKTYFSFIDSNAAYEADPDVEGAEPFDIIDNFKQDTLNYLLLEFEEFENLPKCTAPGFENYSKFKANTATDTGFMCILCIDGKSAAVYGDDGSGKPSESLSIDLEQYTDITFSYDGGTYYMWYSTPNSNYDATQTYWVKLV